MSRERAQRREEREAEAAVRRAARAREAERRERRQARRDAVARLVPWGPRRRRRQLTSLQERRRQAASLTVAVVLALNVLVWLLLESWPAQVTAAIVTLLVAPVLMFRR